MDACCSALFLPLSRVSYNIETVDGTAVKGEDYIEYRESRTFEPGETEHTIEIEIIDDNEWEPDEIFFVKLSLDKIEEQRATIGHKNVNQVTIINDDGEIRSIFIYSWREPNSYCSSNWVAQLPFLISLAITN